MANVTKATVHNEHYKFQNHNTDNTKVLPVSQYLSSVNKLVRNTFI